MSDNLKCGCVFPDTCVQGPNKHLVLLVRSGSIPRSLAARQIAQGQQNQRAQQFQLHVRKLLAGMLAVVMVLCCCDLRSAM
eukprot:1160947-Pelagomonas_calceolata.AAC.12